MIGFSIVTRNLVKRRGRLRALDGLSLSVPRGAVMGMVGANGAGKTTWMMTVAGFLRPDAGEIDLLGNGPFDATRHGGRVAILPQDSELPLEDTPEGALYRFGRLQGLTAAAARRSVRETLAAVNLTARARSRMRTLSHGMRKRAMVAQCFVGRPEVVLLDEPLNGLDPVEADRLRRYILSQRGRQTIVISSHNLKDIERLCTHVAFIEKGRVTRMDSVVSITHAMDRIVFTLAHEPRDIAALSAAVPGAAFEWRAADRLLICTFGEEAGGVAAVNRRLLPALLAQTDVLAVVSGLSLEEAFLSHPPARI